MSDSIQAASITLEFFQKCLEYEIYARNRLRCMSDQGSTMSYQRHDVESEVHAAAKRTDAAFRAWRAVQEAMK